ncbi:polysaccharide lyase family 7 protein [Streptomyces sp. NPDC057702]|uniref:polysaccharide lyase family 7 protein n=1 Tax=unclassified Streptomyces TaxID=2593676 RepID=UPI0036A86D3C
MALASALPVAVLTALLAPAPVQAAADHTGPATGASTPGGGAELPSDVLDLGDWKLTLPVGGDEAPTEIRQPELDGYAHDPYFTVADSGRAVRFRAPVNGVTTSGSNYPRAELREMRRGGGDEIEWSSTSGRHTLTVREAFTHLPKDKPQVVGAQVHAGDDDAFVIRLDGTKLYVTKGDTSRYHLITDDYRLGTVFEVRYVVADGKIRVYVNGELETTIDHVDPTNYFKTGAYTQANCTNSTPCDASNYGEVEVHDVRITHRR